ncbi:hypothetical protein RUM44_003064 [Polyplax serrata]|uniref:Uncharacterized protein n=1 Tax=Polyplax serrata TaxID=468196 RepID=A0ABR1AYY3_POLSC
MLRRVLLLGKRVVQWRQKKPSEKQNDEDELQLPTFRGPFPLVRHRLMATSGELPGPQQGVPSFKLDKLLGPLGDKNMVSTGG